MATNPGLHPTVDLERSGFSVESRRAVYKIQEFFYVTSADQIKSGNSTYYYITVRPSYVIEHALPNAREFIILFSEYENFEARTLDCFQDIIDSFEAHRISAHFRILISNDQDIISKMRRVCDEEPDIPVTIPLRLSQSSAGGFDSTIIAAVRENYHFRDLFAQRDPLRENTYFFGRQGLLSGLRDRAQRCENSGVFGLRKSGKTSVLLALQRACKTDGLRYIPIDCQNRALTALRWNDALKFLAGKLRVSAGLADTPLQLGDFSEAAAAGSFERSIRESFGTSKKSALLAFDEIEHISPSTGIGHWRADADALYFWQTLRSIHQKVPNQFSFVVAGTNPTLLESRKLSESDNPLLEYVHIDYLGGLSDGELQQMCQSLGNLMGMNFDINAISALYRMLGGHPFLSRQVCSHVHRHLPFAGRPKDVGENEIRQAVEQVDFTPLLDDIMLSLKERYPDEFEILEWLALGDHEKVSEFMRLDSAYARHLEGYGFVVRRGDTLDPRMGLSTDYLRRSAKSSGLVKSPSDRWAVIAKRRGEFEVELRKLVRGRLIDNHTRANAAAAILSLVTKSRAEALKGLSLDQMFDAQDCKLYFSDLIQIIKKDREYWSRRLELDSTTLLSALDNVNTLRADAHAKTLNDMDFDKLLDGLDSLSAAL